MQTHTITKSKIFIVDDDYDLLISLTALFESENFHVESTKDSRTLYKCMRQTKPDLLLIDVILKGENGMEICRNLKADDNFKNIPVILMSGMFDFHHQTSSNPLFADDYISKPFSNREILEKVTLLLNDE
ncbi:PleD family two-component system response regulator [Pedobacter aquatilis]|uniref:response regulator n=1 Tax=Pedobacter aquatilis TaxID=351343 RepID=UPI00292CDE03|nr:response regulator [Pedobacter aquatilis]